MMRRNRAILVAALATLISGCAVSEELQIWRGHEAHFASTKHMAFSLGHAGAESATVSEIDRADARDEGWWGVFVPPLPPPPPSDISGQWRGVWRGVDVFEYARSAAAAATFTQDGSVGTGWLRLDDTLAASVPDIIRLKGSLGVDVVYTVRGSDVTVRAPAGAWSLHVEFALVGDELVGHVRNAEAPVSIVLTRVGPSIKRPG
jgi:hypothetical protein